MTFSITFSMLSSKSSFKAPLNGLYGLGPIILNTCTVIKYETGAITYHCFEAIT